MGNLQPIKWLKEVLMGRAHASNDVSPWRIVLAGFTVILAALATYQNSFSGPLIFDDLLAITYNPTIKHLGTALSPPSYLTTGGRPVLNLSFAINHALGGMNVWGYHAFNLGIHTLAGLALFGIARRTLSRPVVPKRLSQAALPLALAVAVIWVVHPLQTESVTYISQRAEALMGLFYLFTLYFFVRGADSSTPVRWQILSVLSCLLGVLSKEIIVTAPVMVLLYDRSFVAGSFREALVRRWRYYLGLAGAWLLLGFLMRNLHERNVSFSQGVQWWDYAMTSCRSFSQYLKLAVWPDPLVLDYGPAVVRRAMEIVPHVLFLAALLLGTVIALRRWPLVGFACAWFFVILSPTTSFVPVVLQPFGEHRMYLPLAGLVGLGVCGLYSLLGRRSLILFTAMAMGLGWLSAQRNEIYRTPLSIWSDTVAKSPENARARFNLGNALFYIPGRSADAITEFETALRLDPNNADAHKNLGCVFGNTPGRLPDAIAHFEAAIRIKPDYAEAHHNLGLALVRSSGQLTKAIAHLQVAIRINPEYADAHRDLGNVLVNILGRIPEAIGHYQTAIRSRPDFSEAHNDLGNALMRIPGRLPDAIAAYQAAVRIRPGDAEMHNNLGAALSGIPERLPEAIAEYEASLRINPNDAEVRNNLGRALGNTEGRMSDAIVHFQAALRINPGYAEAHQNLGMALATLPGRRLEAIAECEEALRINPNLEAARQILDQLRASP